MIGFLYGTVIFSDGQEAILQTSNGVGHQVYLNKVLVEGAPAGVYVSHIIRESEQTLYGFESLRAKKLFETLLQVKGVGPKSAFALMSALRADEIIEAVQSENKKALKAAPGVGEKAAAQMILDLSKKIFKVRMYSDRKVALHQVSTEAHADLPGQLDWQFEKPDESHVEVEASQGSTHLLLDEALMACRELGFKDDQVIPLAQKIMGQSEVHRSEQLVHLVLKQI